MNTIYSDYISRLEPIWGEEKLARFHDAHVLVAGLGGVGVKAAEHLVRSGVGRITLMDYSTVKVQNLCRSFYSNDVGMAKVERLKDHLTRIVPAETGFTPQVEIVNLDVTGQDGREFIAGLTDNGLTGLVNCLDNSEARLALWPESAPEGLFMVFAATFELLGYATCIVPGETPSLEEVFQRMRFKPVSQALEERGLDFVPACPQVGDMSGSLASWAVLHNILIRAGATEISRRASLRGVMQRVNLTEGAIQAVDLLAEDETEKVEKAEEENGA